MIATLILSLCLQYVDPPAKPYAYIEMESRTDCLPCLRWKYTEQRKLEAAGWKVYEKTTTGNAPRFKIVIGERRVVHAGYLTMQRLKEIVDLKGK